MHDKLPFNKFLHIEENKAEVLNVPLSALTCVPKFVNAAFYLRLMLRNIDENKNKSFDKYKFLPVRISFWTLTYISFEYDEDRSQGRAEGQREELQQRGHVRPQSMVQVERGALLQIALVRSLSLQARSGTA